MLQNPIYFLIDFLGEKWLVRNIKKMHNTRTKNEYPTPDSTLTMIRAHPIVSAFWSLEKFVIPLANGKTKAIPFTSDSVFLLLLARDIFVLNKALPKDYQRRIKKNYFSARQELFIGAANIIVGNEVSFTENNISRQGKSYDLKVTTNEQIKLSIECKARVGRDNERKALHNVLAIFVPKMMSALEQYSLNYAILIKPKVTPTAEPLLKAIPEIIRAIENGLHQLEIGQNNYIVTCRKLCDPGAGINKQIVAEINSKYSFAMKTGSPPRSSIVYIPIRYDIYDPFIVGISLERLQKESRDPLKGLLKKANKQLANKKDSLGIVYLKLNDTRRNELDRYIKRIHGDSENYTSIDAIVLYTQEEGVTKEKQQKDVRPFIRISQRVWMSENSPTFMKTAGLVGITCSFRPYIKSCKFRMSNKDIEKLYGIYKKAGVL